MALTMLVLASGALALLPSNAYRDKATASRQPAPEATNGVFPTEAQQNDSSFLTQIWGPAQWPKPGQAHWPPQAAADQLPASSVWQNRFGMAILFGCSFAACSIAGCCSKRFGAAGLVESSVDLAEEPLLTGHRPEQLRSHFGMHLFALGLATWWRYLHPRAIFTHLVCVAIPACFLVLLGRMRTALDENLNSEAWLPLISAGGSAPSGVSDAILEYTFTVTLLYMVMMSMMFFVWHISEQSESGLRHLLHVSGLSRYAYFSVIVGVDGFGLSMLGLVVMVAVANTLLHLRMVMWSSLLLLLFVLSVLVMSSLATGYLMHFLCPSARLASMATQVLVVVVTLSAAFSPLSARVPALGAQSWLTLIFPTIPAYRGLFELVAGCVKGRCLVMSDLTEAIADRNCASLWWSMIVGSDQSTSIIAELTPPLALLGFLVLALAQLLLCWGLVILLDMRCYPELHASRARDTGAPGLQLPSLESKVLHVRGLVHHYGWLQALQSSSAVRTLHGVSFSVNPGEVLGLLGPNGAGKTTCIRCIIGEEEARAGSVEINSSLSSAGSGAYIGLCPQETVLVKDLTVAENLLFFAFLRGASNAQAKSKLQHFLSASRLMEKQACLPDTLSGGMRRRLAVVCALIGSPAVAILDEPTTGLDPVSRRGIWDTIHEVKVSGSCFLLTTHMLEEAEFLCSNLVVLRRGVIVAEGSVQQLKEQWGSGYLLNIDSQPGQQDLVHDLVAGFLPVEDQEPIKSTPNGQLTFRMSIQEETLARLIIAIGEGKASGSIRHWGISQASLEDTYLQIIRTEHEGAQEALHA